MHNPKHYVVIKPNDVEIGKAFDEVGQDILFTQSTPTISIGSKYTVTLLKKGTHLTVLLNDVLTAEFESAQFFADPGAIGLYSEDAQVRIHSVVLKRVL